MENEENSKKTDLQMSLWDVRPVFVVLVLIISLVAGFFSFTYPNYFQFNFLHIVCYILTVIFSIFGLYLWIQGVTQTDKCILNRVLATKGVFGIVRNPIYSGILFVVTGISFVLRSWFIIERYDSCYIFQYLYLVFVNKILKLLIVFFATLSIRKKHFLLSIKKIDSSSLFPIKINYLAKSIPLNNDLL